MLDTAREIILFLTCSLVCWFLLYINSPYNPNKPNAGYITIKNKTVAGLLICGRNPRTKYVKVKDREKLSVKSFAGYIILALIWIVSVIMLLIPEIPCKPSYFPTGGRLPGGVTVATLNEKIPLSLILIFACALLICLIFSVFGGRLKSKDEKSIIGKKFFVAVIIALFLFLFMIIYLLVNLI